jgi:hypothetical protein
MRDPLGSFTTAMWDDSTEAMIRELIGLHLPGRITRRQTTYWEIAIPRTEYQSFYRVHCRGKLESRFVDPDFGSCSLQTKHPLLDYYLEARDTLSFHGTAQDPDRLLRSLEELSVRQSDGWRPLSTYFNPQINSLDLLKSGSGVLLEGPRSLLSKAKDLLASYGIEASILERKPVAPSAQVLLLPPNFMIAEAFRAEMLPGGEAA